jgi:hypothetical protein
MVQAAACVLCKCISPKFKSKLTIQVVIHMCMEAMLGISPYSYLYLKLAKMLCLSYYLLCLLFNKIEKRAEQVLPGSGGGGGEESESGRRDGPNNVYTYK